MNSFELPMVSIVLPVRNEAAFIRHSLGSALAQSYPAGKLEILVVDGMSDDGTREIVKQMADTQDKISISIIDNLALITSAALNHGFRSAKGEIIIRVDGHSEIAPDYVCCCVAHLLRDYADAVGGSIETIGDTFTAQVIATAMITPFGVGNSSFRTLRDKELFTDTVPFPAYRRETIDRLGWYDEEMQCNEDDEYNYRLLKMGGRILLAKDIKSRYFSRSSLNQLWKQYFRYGFWKVRILQKHPRQMRVRQLIPVAFVITLLLSLLAGLLFPWGRVMFMVVIGGYLLSNLGASLITAVKRGIYYLVLLPVTFAVLHFSYGFGFLAGLIKFWNRWEYKFSKTPVQGNDTNG